MKKYRVEFSSNWGDENFPIGIPRKEAPHTGNMFLATHTKHYEPFRVGRRASLGIKQSSEFGENDELLKETMDNRKIGKIKTANVLMTPGKHKFTITATKDYPL